MAYLPINTLAYYQAAPQFRLHKLVDLPVAVMAKNTKQYRLGCGNVLPDEQAITFYALNHCASIVRGKFTPSEPLPDWAAEVMTSYMAELVDQSERLVHYVISIITREARHSKSGDANLWDAVNG